MSSIIRNVCLVSAATAVFGEQAPDVDIANLDALTLTKGTKPSSTSTGSIKDELDDDEFPETEGESDEDKPKVPFTDAEMEDYTEKLKKMMAAAPEDGSEPEGFASVVARLQTLHEDQLQKLMDAVMGGSGEDGAPSGDDDGEDLPDDQEDGEEEL